ncbi:hypothetical protein [Oecophyllibacter saccharovorans]|uniref:hypothetical protein n=1 Tax=Oecophyllibacter saccharovorans TaxID=2558360 RepID=UPI00117588CF|nr:hypothetical protein [Oecophyllibacter saccharovorans]TPW36460.1 hypothetical protein E3203_01375 [Oecophyllibacter saccharovorans]
MKVSSLCQVGKITVQPSGVMDVDMKVGSDDGLCAIPLTKDHGGSYASFGVSPPPEHGHAFLYSYYGHTYVDYTAATAYSGPDQFGVTLIPGQGQPRRQLNVKVTVVAVGAAATPAAATAAKTEKKPEVKAEEPAKTTAHKAVTRKKSVVHHRVVRRRR